MNEKLKERNLKLKLNSVERNEYKKET